MMQDDSKWKPIGSAPLNVPIWTKIDDERGVRNVQIMALTSEGWRVYSEVWRIHGVRLPIFYQPTHWADAGWRAY